MRILFLGSNFIPESNAQANRTYEHVRQWVRDGGDVIVLTDVPNYPEGKVYKGYRNRFMRETIEGIQVMRIPTYIAENKGIVKRAISYASFLPSAIWYSFFVPQKLDMVVATSPHIFTAIAGYFVSRVKKVPFILEIRDIWPASIMASGIIRRNWIIRIFEKIEKLLYKCANHIVVVTDTFKDLIIAKNIDAGKISVFKNGVDLERFNHSLDVSKLEELREYYYLKDKFVVSYIGTTGDAHRAEVLFEVAKLTKDIGIIYMVIGAGAGRKKLEEMQENAGLINFLLIKKQPRDLIPYFLQLSDVSLVHLRRTPLFKTVIPSKMFESMIMGKPIVLGVEGEAKQIVEKAGCGIAVEPENAKEILKAVQCLKEDKILYKMMSEKGKSFVCRYYNRKTIAREYWSLLESQVKEYKVCAR